MDSDSIVFLILLGVIIGFPLFILVVCKIIEAIERIRNYPKLEKELREKNRELENITDHSTNEIEIFRENIQKKIDFFESEINVFKLTLDVFESETNPRNCCAELLKSETRLCLAYISILKGELYDVSEKIVSEKKSDPRNFKTEALDAEIKKLTNRTNYLQDKINLLKKFSSNLTAFPYMAGIISDYETHSLEVLAKGLDWGYAQKRLDKVKSIREIRKDAKEMIERHKGAQYQLAYLLELFPELQDVIECEFSKLPPLKINDVAEQHDCVRDYLSKQEYEQLSSVEKNQLALDRYRKSHQKTNWQIGRDYELYIGYMLSKEGYRVDYFGSYNGLEDLGRDLICKKGGKTIIVQCKYWSKIKLIHEKHITQLYGTVISYCVENGLKETSVTGVLVTNIELSDTAKKMADFLGIKYNENVPVSDYPCIKCNINTDEHGIKTKIYHLPFDQKYDATKIDRPGEFFAMTVKEAEDAGFRRAHKWYGMD